MSALKHASEALCSSIQAHFYICRGRPRFLECQNSKAKSSIKQRCDKKEQRKCRGDKTSNYKVKHDQHKSQQRLKRSAADLKTVLIRSCTFCNVSLEFDSGKTQSRLLARDSHPRLGVKSNMLKNDANPQVLHTLTSTCRS